MTTIYELVASALDTLDVPYANQVYIPATGNQLPDIYLVYFLISSPTRQHADDQETLRTNRVQVSVFSRSGLTDLPDVDGAMSAAGFTRSAKYQLAYSRETRHYGLALDYVYLEES